MATSMALNAIMRNGSYVWRPCGNNNAWANTAVSSLQDVIIPEIEEYFENHSIPDNTKVRWQLIRPDDEASRDISALASTLFNQTGLSSKLVILEPIITSLSATDFTNEIRIIQQRKPDIVSTIYTGNQGAIFVKQSREYNSKYIMHGFGDVATSPAFWTATLGTRVGAVVMAYYPIWTALTNLTVPFVNLFTQYYATPSPAASMVYDTCLVYENAVKKAGTTDNDAVVAAIKDLDFIGVKREIRFDADHDVVNPYYALAQYQPVSLIGQGSPMYNTTSNDLRQVVIWPLASKEADFWIPDYYVPSVLQ
jgi:branched-chain amino acid transport system substrate-binding protein